MQTLTIAEIAKRLNIPESTARFYRDRYEMFIPTVGSGRKKRYRPEALEVLRYVAEASKRNEAQQDVEYALSRMFAINADPEPTAAVTAAPQQPGVMVSAEQMAAAFGQIAAALETMAIQKEEIAELQKHIADLESQQQLQQGQTEALARRMEQTDQGLTELRERHFKKKKWWQFGQ